MYRGFIIDGVRFTSDAENKVRGELMLSTYEEKIQNSLFPMLKDGVTIDGSVVQENWFPQTGKFDVFISHSHNDRDEAIALAGYLHRTFKLKSFIDSTLWGYSDDLLWQLDNDYCLNHGGDTFSYEKRNGSTSHVHMMLVNALTAMMDSCECLFFPKNTKFGPYRRFRRPHEISLIYTELNISKYLRRPKPERGEIKKSWTNESTLFSARKLAISYKLDLHHLDLVNLDMIKVWQASRNMVPIQHEHPLDSLYAIVG